MHTMILIKSHNGANIMIASNMMNIITIVIYIIIVKTSILINTRRFCNHHKISDGNKSHCDRDCKKEDHAMQLDKHSKSCSCSRSQLIGCFCSVSVASCTSNEQSLENHHVNTCKHDGVVSSAAQNRNLSYSNDEQEESIQAQSKDKTLFATFAAPCSKKGKKMRKTSN